MWPSINRFNKNNNSQSDSWRDVFHQDSVCDITWKNVEFTTIKKVVNRKSATVLKDFCSIKIVYTNNFYLINTLYMDNKF